MIWKLRIQCMREQCVGSCRYSTTFCLWSLVWRKSMRTRMDQRYSSSVELEKDGRQQPWPSLDSSCVTSRSPLHSSVRWHLYLLLRQTHSLSIIVIYIVSATSSSLLLSSLLSSLSSHSSSSSYFSLLRLLAELVVWLFYFEILLGLSIWNQTWRGGKSVTSKRQVHPRSLQGQSNLSNLNLKSLSGILEFGCSLAEACSSFV